MKNEITVKLVKSLNGKTKKQVACAHGLGLKKIGRVSKLENTPSVRGMVKKIIHMLEVEE